MAIKSYKQKHGMLSREAANMVEDCTMVGSRATCNPPPTQTDIDYLILIRESVSMATFARQLRADGFSLDTGGEYMGPESVPNQEESHFYSFRKGDLNLIVTKELDFHSRFLSATLLAKRFNLMKKVDRIALFRVILYNT